MLKKIILLSLIKKNINQNGSFKKYYYFLTHMLYYFLFNDNYLELTTVSNFNWFFGFSRL